MQAMKLAPDVFVAKYFYVMFNCVMHQMKQDTLGFCREAIRQNNKISELMFYEKQNENESAVFVAHSGR